MFSVALISRDRSCLAYPDQSEDIFSGTAGKLEAEKDRNGNETTFTYTDAGNVYSVKLPNSRTFVFSYNVEGLVSQVRDEQTTHTVKYTYESGNLATVTLPGEGSARWSFKYDGSHQMTEMTDGRSGHTKTEYEFGKVKKQTDPAGRVLEMEYGTYDARVKNTGTGAVTAYSFSDDDEPTAITRGAGTASATTELLLYDGHGDLTTRTDGNGHVTTYGYDSEGNQTSMVDANKHETKWGYDTKHDVTSITTPNGEKTTIKRDSHGNAEAIERPAPGETTQVTKYKYKTAGELESVEDPLKHVWKYAYDGEGYRESETDPEGNQRTWAYNKDGYFTSTVSPHGNAEGAEKAKYTTEYKLDEQNRVKEIKDPLGHTTKYVYDGDGNVKEVTDGNSHTTSYTYNADNQPTVVKYPKGNTTETEYDSEGHVISQTDGNKHVTKYKRNILGQVTEVEDPLKHKTTKKYDAAGNLAELTDPAKRTTTFVYDPANQLTEVSTLTAKPIPSSTNTTKMATEPRWKTPPARANSPTTNSAVSPKPKTATATS